MDTLRTALERLQIVTEEVPTVERETACPVCLGKGFFRLDVPSDDPRFGKAFACTCVRKVRQEALRWELLADSGLADMEHMKFAGWELSGEAAPGSPYAAYVAASNYASGHASTPWALIFGGYGGGKTHLACAIGFATLEKFTSVAFHVVPDLLDDLRAGYKREGGASFDSLMHRLKTVPLLILDDFGAGQIDTPWVQDKLFQVLNTRYNRRMRTVFTTNLALADIEPRLRSRLGDSKYTLKIYVKADDARLTGGN